MMFRMNNDRRVHVLGLNPREQFLLKLILSNLVAGYIDKSVQESMLFKTGTAVEQRASMANGLFWRYVDFCDLLCPESMLGRGRPKVLIIEQRMMKYVVQAVNGYDPHDCLLSERHRGFLSNGFEELQKKVVESSQFLYNQLEIDRARNSGQS